MIFKIIEFFVLIYKSRKFLGNVSFDWSDALGICKISKSWTIYTNLMTKLRPYLFIIIPLFIPRMNLNLAINFPAFVRGVIYRRIENVCHVINGQVWVRFLNSQKKIWKKMFVNIQKFPREFKSFSRDLSIQKIN